MLFSIIDNVVEKGFDMQICCPLTGCVTLSTYYWVLDMCGNMAWDQHSLSLMLRFWSHGRHNWVERIQWYHQSLSHWRRLKRSLLLLPLKKHRWLKWQFWGNAYIQYSLMSFSVSKTFAITIYIPMAMHLMTIIHCPIVYSHRVFVWSVWLTYIHVCKDDAIARSIWISKI